MSGSDGSEYSEDDNEQTSGSRRQYDRSDDDDEVRFLTARVLAAVNASSKVSIPLFLKI